MYRFICIIVILVSSSSGFIFREEPMPRNASRTPSPRTAQKTKSAKNVVRTRQGEDARCGCVPLGRCVSSDANTDGTGLIDFRVVTDLPAPPVNPCLDGMQACCVAGPAPPCGLRYEAPQPAPTGPGQSQFGAYPWQAVFLTGPSGDLYSGSGVLIDQRHVITAAHVIVSFLDDISDMKVRFGEWDASSIDEPIPHEEFGVENAFVHPEFQNGNLQNDIAVIRLRNNVLLGTSPIVAAACLPAMPFSDCNCGCWVAGWGKNAFTGQFQNIQKHVGLVVWPPAVCQQTLRATRLGEAFVFDAKSFTCAGGEPGEDACTGDGGSPLSCEVDGRWFIPGLVAWGIGCGEPTVPGVYVNVLSYVPWINHVVAS